MKYNPRVNEVRLPLPGFADLHPYSRRRVQGALELMVGSGVPAEIAGLQASRCSRRPAPTASSPGCCSCAPITRRGDARKRRIIPDTAHGTNPAGRDGRLRGDAVPSDARGGVDLEALRRRSTTDVAGLMLTNPNTLGLFDENIARSRPCTRPARCCTTTAPT
jgi:glycine dehydrogenase subunit 2